jgi:hypothetical protein
MKYFKWPPDFINTMTWTNFMLYMASIPRYDGKQKAPPIEVKDSDDIF